MSNKSQLRIIIVAAALIVAGYFAYEALSDNSVLNVRASVLSASALLAGLLLVQVVKE